MRTVIRFKGIVYSAIRKAAKRKASKGARHVSALKKMEALQNRMGNAMTVDLVHGIRTFKRDIPADKLYQSWATGDYEGLMRDIPWEQLHPRMQKASNNFLESAIAGAQFALKELPTPEKPEFRMDTSNPRLTKYIRTKSAELVVKIERESRETIKDAVTASFDKALTPRRVASMIKGSVGLLPNHVKAVENYTQKLMKDGASETKALELGDRYRERLVQYRLTMIARTESAKALNEGQVLVWEEGARQGLIDKKTFTKIWVAAGDDPCPECEEADGQEVGLDEQFEVGGELLNCPPAHPHCNCIVNSEFGEAK